MKKKNALKLNESQFENLVNKIVKESVKKIIKEDYHEFRPFPQEKPEPFKRIIIRDNKGKASGHLEPVVWDGKRFTTDMAHHLMADTNNIVAWKYLEKI